MKRSCISCSSRKPIKHRRTVTKHSQLRQYQWIVNNFSTSFVKLQLCNKQRISKEILLHRSIFELRSRSRSIRLLCSPGVCRLVANLLSLHSVSCRHSTGAASDLYLYKHSHYFYKLFFHAARSS